MPAIPLSRIPVLASAVLLACATLGTGCDGGIIVQVDGGADAGGDQGVDLGAMDAGMDAGQSASCEVDNGGCDALVTCTMEDDDVLCGACPSGYAGDGATGCDDVNECDTANGGCAQQCTNDAGGFTCSCGSGYALNVDGLGCDDVNECDTANGGCAQQCTNDVGGFTCSCGSGYLLNVDGLGCDDVNECDTANGGCDLNAACANNLGAPPTCTCNVGYGGDGTTCTLLCGNGVLDDGEVCDDDGNEDGDGCRADCLGLEECGDGLLDVDEECDDDNVLAGDGCRADCRGLEECGDGIIDAITGEQCDDGSDMDGDGCSGVCEFEFPFTSVAAQVVSGMLSCTSASSNTGRKIGLDDAGAIYVAMKCGGAAYIASSTDRGVTYADPINVVAANVIELAIEGGPPGVAWAVAVLSDTTLVLSQTADYGATWSAPVTLATGLVNVGFSIDSFGDAVYVTAIRQANTIDVFRNLTSGVGAFEFTRVPQANSFHDIMVDRVSGAVWLGSDNPAFRVRSSVDHGVTFGAESNPPGQAFFSDWAASNGFLYVVGTNGDTNVDVIPLSAPGTSTQAEGLPSGVAFAQVRAIDADALGNAYVVSQLSSGAVQLDRLVTGGSAVAAADLRAVAVTGNAPGVAGLPSNNGAAVVYTNGTSVYAAIVVY
ncbi:MAG: hypothetical protein H6726_07635 [Sandaracinaceae bacterium]|nr:hypothetical protein [Sandaracinaceae bacterium]